MKRIILLFLLLVVGLTTTSCIAGVFEEEIKVVFVCDGDEIGSGVVTQFKNIKTPELDSKYIPANYTFFGWTALNPNKIKATDENFSEEYLYAGAMVHWSDIKDHIKNKTVTYQALMINKDDIPVVHHYVSIAWYDKEATSGITTKQMEQFTDKLKAYLTSQGVPESELNTIVIRGYTGQVGQSCGAIMKDGDIDIMLGWGSKTNVVDTGGMKEEMLLESVSFQVTYNGTVKNRTIHRLTDNEAVLLVMEWMKGEECSSIFN